MPNHRALHYVASKRITEPTMAFCKLCITIPAPRVSTHAADHQVSLDVMLFAFNLSVDFSIALITVLEL